MLPFQTHGRWHFVILFGFLAQSVSSLPAEVLPSTAFLDQNSVSTYLDPISLDTNRVSSVSSSSKNNSSYFSSKKLKTKKSTGPVYKSPYYNPAINRADYTYDIAGDVDSAVDSYGAPILSPVAAPDYADYSYASGTGSGTGTGAGLSAPSVSGTGYGAPSAPVLTGDSYYPAPPGDYPEYPTATGTGSGTGTGSSTGDFLPPEIPQSSLLAALGVALLFLFPVTVFIESDPVDYDGMGMREEPGIIETIESFVDTIDTTTMTPREFDFDSGEDCGPWTLCAVTNFVAKLGSRFLRKSPKNNNLSV